MSALVSISRLGGSVGYLLLHNGDSWRAYLSYTPCASQARLDVPVGSYRRPRRRC
jgi:hypothetical protein